jgi:TolB protein
MIKLFYSALFYIFLCTHSFATTQININKGNIDSIPIAISPTSGSSAQDISIGEDMKNVISNDLNSSGLIRVISEKSYLEKISDFNITPNFELWKNINSAALVTGQVSVKNGNIEAHFKLWDTFSGKTLFAKSFSSNRAFWRKLSHIIADEIYTRLTGEYPYFNTKIVYVAETSAGIKRIKRLAIMDQDGANHQFLTQGENLVLTPRFSPNSRKVLYMSYAHNIPRVHIRDLITNVDTVLGDFPGMSFAPRFSPDGTKAILSVAFRGSSNIYLLDLVNLKQKKLTNISAIDTSPSFSPNGEKIVFTSDRNGSPKLYTMNSDGSNISQISTGKGVYTTPVWSPREDLIAFTRAFEGKFYIGVIRPDGSGERLLTEGYMVEGPTWSPNGRVIMFTRSKENQRGRWGESKLYSIDITGFNEREMESPVDGSDPTWSNLLN